MSILSDREIKALCTKPKFVVYAGDKDKPIVQNFFIHDNVKEFVDMQNQQMFGTSSYLEARSKFPESIINERWIGYRDVQDSDLINWKPLITPFTEQSVKELNGKPIPSYGLSSYSYDIRLGRNFKVFRKPIDFPDGDSEIIDLATRNPTSGLMTDVLDVDYIDIMPGQFVLGHAVEHLNMARDLTGVCMAKSSLARVGLDAKVTPVEASWSGILTIEMSNCSPFPIRVWSGMGIMAIVFHKGNMPCEVAYNERNGTGGKYQNQPALPVETIN